MKSRTPKYRSKYWQQYRAAALPYVVKSCAICGAQFHKESANDGNAKTCKKCRDGVCDSCGKKFVRKHLASKFCSRVCYAEFQSKSEPPQFAAKRGKRPRVALKNRRSKHGCAEDVDWRKAVFARDKFTCKDCGATGTRLQAHHIKPFKAFPELRHVLSNGITLCVPCHKKTDSYGWSAYWSKSRGAAVPRRAPTRDARQYAERRTEPRRGQRAMNVEQTLELPTTVERKTHPPLCSSDLLCRPVAILYARSDSIYKTLEGCDVWDATRDARNFPGGMPVVAHPPCRAWSALAHLAKPRPDEKDLARHAVKVVRECGGVLEHPISSRLWADQKLPQSGERDAWGGYTVILPQWWFGHRAEKGTRFYIVGTAMKDLPEVKLKLGDAPCVVTTSKRKCQTPPAEWRERLGNREKEGTPPDMARWLVAVARASRHNAELSDSRPR